MFIRDCSDLHMTLAKCHILHRCKSLLINIQLKISYNLLEKSKTIYYIRIRVWYSAFIQKPICQENDAILYKIFLNSLSNKCIT